MTYLYAVALRQRVGKRHNYPANPLIAVLMVISIISGTAHASVADTVPGNRMRSGHVEFDIETLKARGLDPELASYFAEKPRFVGGMHRVTISVNGRPHGTINVRFDPQGNVCFDRHLITRARLKMPEALMPAHQFSPFEFLINLASGRERVHWRERTQSDTPDTPVTPDTEANTLAHVDKQTPVAAMAADVALPANPAHPPPAAAPDAAAPDDCFDYRRFEPRIEIDADAARDALAIVMPAEALEEPRPGDGASSGGLGALLNYNVMGTVNRSSGGGSTFFYSNTETGFNAGDWIVRSQQNYWRQQHASAFEMPYVYAQKTYVDAGYMLQAGQIVLNNPVVDGTPIEGVQIMPDNALSVSDTGSEIQGVAIQQSRAEIRQAGVLIYTTMVPAGPFRLRHVPLIDRTSLIDVTLVDDAGNRRTFTVSPASLPAPRSAPPGMSLAIGRVFVYRAPDSMARPLVASIAKHWNVGKASSLTAGAIVSSRHQAVGVSHAMPVSDTGASASTTLQLSNAPRLGERGASMAISLSAQLPQDLSLTVLGNRQTPGFHSLSDTLYDIPDTVRHSPYWNVMRSYRIRDMLSSSMNWNSRRMGALTFSYNRFSTYVGVTGEHTALSWTRQFGRANLSVSLDRSFGSGGGSSGTAIFSSLNFPLGRARINTYLTNTSGVVRGGVGASQTINDYASYNIGAERSEHKHSERAYGTLSLRPRYLQTSLSASAQRRSGALSGQIQGGIVATREGVTLSPYPVGDTFGVISADRVSGVSISTPAGIVWTDARGRAVVGSLPAYTETNTIVRTKGLPHNLEVTDGYSELRAGRGSVNFIRVHLRKISRLLLNVRTHDGQPLPLGTSIRDDQDKYVTTSVGDGTVFLERHTSGTLFAGLPNGERCRLTFEPPASSDQDTALTTVDALCTHTHVH